MARGRTIFLFWEKSFNQSLFFFIIDIIFRLTRDSYCTILSTPYERPLASQHIYYIKYIILFQIYIVWIFWIFRNTILQYLNSYLCIKSSWIILLLDIYIPNFIKFMNSIYQKIEIKSYRIEFVYFSSKSNEKEKKTFFYFYFLERNINDLYPK